LSWLVCTECSNVRSYFRNAADCVAHHRRKHYVAIPRAAAAVNALIHSSGVVSSLESADLAVPALDSADDEVPALESADLAVPALESADLAVPALELADLAVPALELADLAVPALESADDVVPASESADLAVPSFLFGDFNAHKFILLDIPQKILEAMYAAVSVLPLTQYEVICRSLKQIRFYKSFHLLFQEDNNLWGEFFSVLRNCFFKHHPHLDTNEINATILVTDGPMVKPQQPHMDYCWETILLPSRRESRQNRCKFLKGSCQIPFTGHLPLTSDGSYIYLWSGPGVGIPYHIPYGKMLIIRGDVVHCGGLPP
jgi:hypothetical protein